MKSNFTKGLWETILVTYVSASMFLYGIMKYAQFEFRPYSDKLVGELTDMQLMWAFYGRTLTFPIIIGAFEILGAGLLFFRKTRLIGCFLLTTILINIIIQDVIYGVLGGAILSAVIYQLIIFYIVYKHRQRVYDALKLVILPSQHSFLWWMVQAVIGLFIAIAIKMTTGI